MEWFYLSVAFDDALIFIYPLRAWQQLELLSFGFWA
jgi:hypothetical protein